MVFQRKGNYEVAARLMSTSDLAGVLDPTTDFGAAMALLLEDIEVSGTLPSGGVTGQFLKKLSNADGDGNWDDITMDDVDGLIAELEGLATDAAVNAIASAVALKASQSSVDALTTTVAGKASTASVTALSATVDSKASSASVAALTLGSLSDVDENVAPADDDSVLYDSATGQFRPASLSGLFAAADPSTGKLQPAKAAPFSLFGFIVEEGSDPPAGLEEILGLGVPILGFEKAATPSVVPLLLTNNFAQAPATGVVLTIPEILAVNDKLILAVGYSAEATVPDHHNLVWSSGAATVTWTTKAVPNSTMAVVMAEIKITTQVNAAATLTISNRNVSDGAIQRAHTLAILARTPHVLASALDRQVAHASGSSSSTMTAVSTPATAADTSQAHEVVLGAVAWNAGSGGTTRVLTGTGGWTKIQEIKSDNGTAGRSLALFWKELVVVGKPALTTLMTASDNTTGQFSAQIATLKGS